MKLQTKILLSLLAGIIAVYALSQVAQHFTANAVIARRANEALKRAESADWDWVEKLMHANRAALFAAMTSGDMDMFRELLAAQRAEQGVLAISLYNRHGVVAFSSDPQRLKQPIALDLKERLYASAQPVKRRTETAYEFYQPAAVTTACLECHKEFKNVGVGGVLEFRYTIETLAAVQGQWTGFVAEMQRSMATISAFTAAILVLAVSALIVVLVRRQIARPLQNIARTINHGAKDVHAVAAQIASETHSLADGASAQAAALEETSASLEEISGMVRASADHAREAAGAATQARTSADAGTVQIDKLKTSMAAIQTASEDITNILRTIDEIAFQTNILALNAAVEAARAGEAGLGFAVVADEVRALAQRCAHAAKETATKVEHSLGKSREGGKLTATVAATFTTIQREIQRVDALVAEIATAAKEQSQGAAQIVTAVTEMDRVTQANAAHAESTAGATEDLNQQAEALTQAVKSLQRLVDGSHADERPAAEPRFARALAGGAAATLSSDMRPRRPLAAASPVPAPAFRSLTPPNNLITWSEDAMATGVATVDEQHRELIDRINALHAACLAGTARGELMKMLVFIGDYAKAHFAEEESIMAQHRCPAHGANQAAHAQFLRDYEELCAIVQRDGASTGAVLRLKQMLGNWLQKHICKVDRSLRQCPGAQTAASAVVAVP